MEGVLVFLSVVIIIASYAIIGHNISKAVTENMKDVMDRQYCYIFGMAFWPIMFTVVLLLKLPFRIFYVITKSILRKPE